MASISAEEVKTLEKARQQLFQLSTSLSQLRFDLERGVNSLPPWPSLQTASALISHTMKTLIDHLKANRDLLSSAHVYPLPQFPGHTQESLLTQLLRKKLDPAVEDWVGEGQKAAGQLRQRYSHSAAGADEQATTLSKPELKELWDWAGPAANNIAKEVLLSVDEYSEDEDEDEDDDADDEVTETETSTLKQKPASGSFKGQKIVVPSLSIEEVYQFMCTGTQR